MFSSPRASGTEAMVISASWLSRTGEGDGTLNLRGVSTVLSLAWFLKGLLPYHRVSQRTDCLQAIPFGRRTLYS